MEYVIRKTALSDIGINSSEWERANVFKIDKLNWEKEFPYAPETVCRMLYSPDGIFVKFSSDEEPHSVCTEKNGDVYRDSCAEFFFSPDNREEYFNFEINSLGTLHIGFGGGREQRTLIDYDKSDFKIEKNISEKSWEIKYFIPCGFVETYANCPLGCGISGNIYKCAEDFNPHFLSFAEIKTEAPDFHRPEYFVRFRAE